jgi:hypothetical protein
MLVCIDHAPGGLLRPTQTPAAQEPEPLVPQRVRDAVRAIGPGGTSLRVSRRLGVSRQRAGHLIARARRLGLIERTGRSVGSAIEYRATHETPD